MHPTSGDDAVMCDWGLAISTVGTLASAALQVSGQHQQAAANRSAANYRAAVARNNATIAGWQAQDAIDRGRIEEQRHREQVQRLKGRQMAAMAASGVDPTTGSSLDILGDTAAMGELDSLQIRDNAQREAWRYRNEAVQHAADSGLYSLQGRSGGGVPVGPVLGAIGQVADRWYQYSLEDGGTGAKPKGSASYRDLRTGGLY